MATLMLLRHAKAEPGSATDEVRALTPSGREQARRVAEHVRSRVPQLVLCSAAVRAQQTWQRLAWGLADHGIDTAGIELTVLESLYQASPHSVLAEVRAHGGDAGTVLVVGHEPVMSLTAVALAGEGSERASSHQVSAGLPTAGLALIETNGAWADLGQGHARLTAVLRTECD